MICALQLSLFARVMSDLPVNHTTVSFFNPHPALVICNHFSMQNEQKKKKKTCHRLKFSPFYLLQSSSFLSPSPTNRRTDLFIEMQPKFQKLFGEGNNLLQCGFIITQNKPSKGWNKQMKLFMPVWNGEIFRSEALSSFTFMHFSLSGYNNNFTEK